MSDYIQYYHPKHYHSAKEHIHVGSDANEQADLLREHVELQITFPEVINSEPVEFESMLEFPEIRGLPPIRNGLLALHRDAPKLPSQHHIDTVHTMDALGSDHGTASNASAAMGHVHNGSDFIQEDASNTESIPENYQNHSMGYMDGVDENKIGYNRDSEGMIKSKFPISIGETPALVDVAKHASGEGGFGPKISKGIPVFSQKQLG